MKIMFMCCYVHILKLIVKEGLKEVNDFILKIYWVVEYVTSSLNDVAFLTFNMSWKYK